MFWQTATTFALYVTVASLDGFNISLVIQDSSILIVS